MRTPLLISLLAIGCSAPDLDGLFTQVNVSTGGRAETVDAARTLIENATESLHVAMPAGEDTELSALLIDAYNDGLDVEVTTDFDQVDDAGIQALIAADVPVTRTNDGLEYFEFVLGTDVSWESADTILSSSFIVADRLSFMSTSELGFGHDGARVIIEGRGQDLADDLLKEHNQLMGNGQDAADATSTTAFDNQAKSIADPRWRYPLRTGAHAEVWFGPQERVTKRIIDAVYAARSDIRILTDDFANEGLTKALEDKASQGFDVEIIVGPRWNQTNTALARLLQSNTPNVSKRRVASGRVPTVVLIDLDTARDGNAYTARGFVLSHDLYSAERLYRGSPVTTDQLIDGVLWVFEDANNGGTPEDVSDEISAIYGLYAEHRDAAGSL